MSHNDKRTPHTDALETLGYVHSQEEHRDAIHLAVEQVEAGENLKPGDHIGFGSDGKVYRSVRKMNKAVGIVDPFLTSPLISGDKFWLVVYPRQVTSLRHVWAHPDFPEKVEEVSLEELSTEDLLAEIGKRATAPKK